MEKIKLDIQWKMVSNNKMKSLKAVKGISAGELLENLGLAAEKDQLFLIYNGRPVFLDDLLDIDGEIIIMPILIGG